MMWHWLLLMCFLVPVIRSQVPCSIIDEELDLPCQCIQIDESPDIKINCDNVAFPKDFPLLPFKMQITEYRQRHAGIQSLSGQLFTASDLPLNKIDFSRNVIRSMSPGVWEGLEGVLEDLSVRHNLLGDTYNVISGAFNPQPQQSYTEISKLVALQKLDLGHNYIRKLDNGLFSQLENLLILRLDGNSIMKVPTAIFTGLISVKLITLQDNDISALQEEAFITTPALEALDLSGNRISNIADNSFQGLGNLTDLDLSQNKLSELNSGVFRGLINLHNLDLSGNFLTEVPADALKKLKNVKSLMLQDNHIQTLGGVVALGPLKSLQSLSLARNNIGELTPGTFQQLSGLKKLDLAVNSIRKVEDEAFIGLTSLDTLHLDDNNIFAIPWAALEKVSSIKTLTLDYNRVRVISAENLQSVTMLSKLSLAHNIIVEIPVGTFVNFTQLTELNLYGNQLQNILSKSLDGLRDNLRELNLGLNLLKELPELDFPKLKTLGLSKNNIETLPSDAFLLLPELQSLDLSENELSSLPATLLYPLAKLASINLSKNRISKIHQRQFNDLFINVINLQHNEILEIPTEAFMNCPLIHTIDLSHNKLDRIQDGAFSNTPFIHILRLNNNKLTSFKQEYFDLTTPFVGTELRILDVSNNDITFMQSEALHMHPEITWISLAHNRLSYLPYLFVQRAVNLKHLDVGYNMIQKLESDDFSNSTYLRELSLNNNLIKKINETTFQFSTQLQELNLSYNMISSLPEDLFLGISRLSLDLSHNDLSSFPIAIFQQNRLNKLQSLNLAHNLFTSIPVQALKKQSFSLSDLNMAHNQINHIPNNADTLINVKSLDLSFNPLKSDDIIVLLNEPKLTGHINLSGTNITEVPVIESRFLLSLNLSHNNIVTLKDQSFSKTEHIRVLDVSHNRIPNLSYGLATAWPMMSDLRVLDISHNPIAYIVRGDFNYLNNLEILRASHLPRVARVESTALQPLHALKELYLHTLPRIGTLHTREVLEAVPGLEVVDIDLTEREVHDHLHPAFSPRLKSLVVRGKSLHALSGGAFGGINSPELEIGLVNTSISHLRSNVFIPVPMSSKITLNVEHSKIASLSQQFLNSLDSRHRHIQLTGLDTNPIFCDCNVQGLQTWLQALKPINQLYNVTCAAPQDLKGFQLTMIPTSNLTCKGRPSTTTTDLPQFTTSIKSITTDNIITYDTNGDQTGKIEEKENLRPSRAGALTNMDTLIIGVVGGVVAFVALLIIIICLLRLRSDSQYKGGPLAAPCTCVKPPHPPPNWGYPGPYPTLPHAHTSRQGTMKAMPPSTPVPPSYGTVGARSSRSYYSGPPYFMGYPAESETDHR